MAAEAVLEVNVHPLVLVSIAEHSTRDRYQRGRDRCLGVLLGQQDGLQVQVLETLELGWKPRSEAGSSSSSSSGAAAVQDDSKMQDGEANDSDPVINEESLDRDLELFRQVFEDYELLGWYSSGTQPSQHDHVLHQLMLDRNERPLYLMLDPDPAPDARELPLQVFEQRLQIVDNGMRHLDFVPVPFTITSDEAERTTMLHCASQVVAQGSGMAPVASPSAGSSSSSSSSSTSSSSSASSSSSSSSASSAAAGEGSGTAELLVLDDKRPPSQVISHFGGLAKAVRSLNGRLRVLRQVLLDHRAGKIELSQADLRNLKSLCQRLPVMDSDQFRDQFAAEQLDTLLLTYLVGMGKGAVQLHELLAKFNMSVPPAGVSDRLRSGDGRGEREHRSGLMGLAMDAGGFFGRGGF